MAFVTLDQLKEALLVDHYDDDDALTLALDAATDRITAHLKGAPDPVPDSVKAATIILAGRLYAPEGEYSDELQSGRLPRRVTMMISHLRTPTLS